MIYVLREVEDELYKIELLKAEDIGVYDPHLVKMKGKNINILLLCNQWRRLIRFALYKVGKMMLN